MTPAEQRQIVPVEPTDNMIEAAYPLLNARRHDTPARARQLCREIWLAMIDQQPRLRSPGLTGLQRKVHEFIAHHQAETGETPSYSVIAKHTGHYRTADGRRRKDGGRPSICRIVEQLEKKGVLSRHHSPRQTSVITLHILPGEPLPKRDHK